MVSNGSFGHASAVALVLLLGLAGCRDEVPRGSGPTAASAASTAKPSGRRTELVGADRRVAEALAFEPAVLDLGRLVPGGNAAGSVRMKNVSDDELELVDLTAPCECTTADLELPLRLLPGASVELPIRLDLGSLTRGGLSAEAGPDAELVQRELLVWTRTGRVATLPVVAELSEQLLVSPVVLRLGEILVGESAEGTISIGPGRERDQPVRVLAVIPRGSAEGRDDGGAWPLPEVRERPSSRGVELAVRWGPFSTPGLAHASLQIQTDAEDRPVMAQVLARVSTLLQAEPPAVVALEAFPHRPIVQEIRLHRRDGVPLLVQGIGCTSGRVTYDLLPDPGDGSQRVELVVPVPPWPNVTEGRVFIDTDAPGNGRLVIPVRVRARGRD